jgi:hypothetical protein
LACSITPSLDSSVQRYLPWWRLADPQASARITVRHLLYQVSGLSKATGNEHATTTDNRASALEDQVRELRSAKVAGTVGETWQYSNANYNTLGMIVQAVSGQSYETYVRAHSHAARYAQLRHVGHRRRAAWSCNGLDCVGSISSVCCPSAARARFIRRRRMTLL